jgi:site-specific recombinase XerD
MDLQTAMQAFQMENAARKLSARTRRSYQDNLDQFLEYAGNIDLKDLTPELVNSFIQWYGDRPGRVGDRISPATLHKAYAVINRFCRWIYLQRWIDRCITDFTRAPRLNKPIKDTLTDEEIARLLHSVRGNVRDHLIFSFFLDTGCRLNEVVQLNVDDIDFEQRLVKVHGKGNKEGVVPIGQRVTRDLFVYIHNVRDAAPGERALFLNRDGTRLEYNGLSQLIRRRFDKLGIEGRAHKMRHTFATQFLRNGGNLEALRRILRHSDIKVTQQYLHLVNDDLIAEHDRYAPMDRMR